MRKNALILCFIYKLDFGALETMAVTTNPTSFPSSGPSQFPSSTPPATFPLSPSLSSPTHPTQSPTSPSILSDPSILVPRPRLRSTTSVHSSSRPTSTAYPTSPVDTVPPVPPIPASVGEGVGPARSRSRSRRRPRSRTDSTISNAAMVRRSQVVSGEMNVEELEDDPPTAPGQGQHSSTFLRYLRFARKRRADNQQQQDGESASRGRR